MSKEEVRARFEDLAFSLVADAEGQLLLVDWQVVAEGTMNGTLHCNGWLDEIRTWLRSEFGQSAHSLWTMSTRLQTPRSLPEEWFEEDTMLGDYLRSVREHQQDVTGKLNLAKFIDRELADDALVSAIQFDADRRREILRESAMMGVKLLSGTDGI